MADMVSFEEEIEGHRHGEKEKAFLGEGRDSQHPSSLILYPSCFLSSSLPPNSPWDHSGCPPQESTHLSWLQLPSLARFVSHGVPVTIPTLIRDPANEYLVS